MSALTDIFTSLANKIRSKLGTTTTYTPAQAIAAIDDVYDKGYDDAYVPTQTKTVTAIASGTVSVTPDSGYTLSEVTVNPTPSQTKSVTPSTSAQTISPDSGKLLSSVSISAISPQRSAGTAASAAGRDSTGPYVYFPYGWWNNHSSGRNYTRLTEAQAISTVATEEKAGALTPNSTTALVITPSSGHLLSKVSVSVADHTATYTPTSRGAALDMGANHSYRYVKTTSIPNDNSSTYTATGAGSAIDMGATNNYRYVNTNPVFTSGIKNGVDTFLQGIARTAFWFSINNVSGGDVTTTTVSGQNQVTINSINTGIIVVTNRNTGKFINLILKYNTYWRAIDDAAGNTQNSGLTYVNASQVGKIVLRTASGIDNFFNVWIYNVY